MATSIIKKMDDSVKKLYESLGDTIYHYTSPSGLKGILGGLPSLYFTRYDCLNDFTEGKIIQPIYNKVLDIYQNEHTEASEFCRLIQDIKPSNTTYIPLNGKIPGSHNIDETNSCVVQEIECTPYICCFSLDPDALPMWTYYTMHIGVRPLYGKCNIFSLYISSPEFIPSAQNNPVDVNAPHYHS